MGGERIVIGVAAFVAVLLQVLLAPHIAIGYALPNFMVAICLVAAILRHEFSNPVLPFALGLIFDFASGGPVGAMALSLTITTTFGSWLYERVKNDTAFMAISVLALSVFVTELIYGVVFLLFGYPAGVLEAFVYRMLPCFAYDFVIALALYAFLSRFFNGETMTHTEIKQL